jgi:PIN domain nuclease of toxin-antitoxin system
LRALLDTNVLLWAALSPPSLSMAARDVLVDERNTLLISAASAWEIATKVRLGKLPEAVMFERDFIASAQSAGYTLLPISVEAALRSGRLVGAHRDPFDRMIAAQALELDIEVISNDIQLDGFGVRRIW